MISYNATKCYIWYEINKLDSFIIPFIFTSSRVFPWNYSKETKSVVNEYNVVRNILAKWTMLIYGLGEILHKQLDIKFFCVKRISYKTIKVLNRCLHYMGRNNLFHKELSLGILTISIYHSKVFIMMNIQTYMHLFVLRVFMRHFYALHISICQ